MKSGAIEAASRRRSFLRFKRFRALFSEYNISGFFMTRRGSFLLSVSDCIFVDDDFLHNLLKKVREALP